MPYADNDGVNIFYVQEGEGTPIILHHGLAGSHLDWIRGADYLGALRDSYHVIALDARGRGKSDKPHAPEEHSLGNMVGDVTAVLDDVGLEKAHFWGYSMGGRVGLAAGVYSPDRFSSLIIGGAGLTERDSEDTIEICRYYRREYEKRVPIYDKGRDAASSYLNETMDKDTHPYMIERWLNADPRALIAYCSYQENIGMKETLPTLNLPCLFYVGDKDTERYSRVIECVEIMQNADFVSLPGIDHGGAFRRKDIVLPHVLKFLNTLE
jgi:pimeloyl-ACP methyl ester carboxylesterase